MTFDEMITFVRLQADADDSDAPQSMLTVHARIAYNDILSRKAAWDHLEVHYDMVTVADQQEYDVQTDISGGADLERIYSITSPTGISYRLRYITRADADLMFTNNDNTGKPEYYTLYNDQIVFYPTPDAVYSLKVHGFREAVAWPSTAGSEPDLPREFDDVIAWYMLSGYYMSQEDTQLAGAYMVEYNQMLERLLKGVSGRNINPRPNILGGQNGRFPSWYDRQKSMVEG